MADVMIRIRMDQLSQVDLAGMSSAAVARALSSAAARITAYAKSIVPVRTGRLRDSVIVSPTLKTIQMIWNPIDPLNAYHYAKVVDEGRPGGKIITPKGNYPLKWPGAIQYLGGGRMAPTRDGFIRAWSVTQGPMDPKRFSDHMRIVAPQFVREAIIEELQGVTIP